jgi:hypothetical protein
MSRANVSSETLDSIRESMPAVWKRMVAFGQKSPRVAGIPEEDRIHETAFGEMAE